jgi:pyruvate dehydrogenase E2 component (dihydrolipoamide acetyltransferase)
VPTELKLPELGENIDSGDLTRILVAVGDTIAKDQAVIELETEKATVEVPSTMAGRIASIQVKEGEKVKVGQVILTLEDGAAAPPKEAEPAKAAAPPAKREEPNKEAPAQAAPPSAAPVAPSGPVEFRLPELGENIESGDLTKILVAVGDVIAKDQAVIELETEKATVEVPSSVAGRVTAIHVKQGEKIKVGQAILTVEGAAPAPAAPKAAAAAQPPAKEAPPGPATPTATVAVHDEEDEDLEAAVAAGAMPPATGVPAPAAPSVRRLARELGVDINAVRGSGPRGRISIEDVKAHVKAVMKSVSAGAAPMHGVAAPTLPDFSKWGAVERQRMTGIRRATARHLSHAWQTVPHVTQHDKADVSGIAELQKKLGKKVEQAGGKLTMTAIALKVVASALKVYPQFAASVDLAHEEIIYKKYCHIGVAVDTDRGLLVPVIRDADHKNILELSVELGQKAEKARAGKLTLDEMQGGVFSITNLGGIGGSHFSPIVNSPEVAILGLSRSRMEPVWTGEKFEPRNLLPLSLSYDHRLIDGADAARFLRWVVEAFEQPFLLSFEG